MLIRFKKSFAPVNEIPVARCCTVWTDRSDSREYLLVGDQMLWFGTLLPNSLINPNQIRSHGIMVNDDPFDLTRRLGIESDDAFIPFDTTGTVVYFETRAPNDWEKTHLPVMLLTGEEWDPSQDLLFPEKQSRESIEMRNIRSLTSEVTHRVTAQAEQYEDDILLSKISCVYDSREFCARLISSVNIATTYRNDIDKWNEQRNSSSIISNERHSEVTP